MRKHADRLRMMATPNIRKLKHQELKNQTGGVFAGPLETTTNN